MRALLAAAMTVAALAVAVGGATPAAFGQEEGVTLDPSDPAAKEYALPHEEARREAGDAATAPVEPGKRDSELFGEGIDEESERAQAASSEEPSVGERSDEVPATSAASATTPEPADEPTRASMESSGPGATTAMLGGAAAVLLIALIGGYGLRAVGGPRD